MVIYSLTAAEFGKDNDGDGCSKFVCLKSCAPAAGTLVLSAVCCSMLRAHAASQHQVDG